MKHVTRQQMKELDRQSIEEYGIPAVILMENAGRAVAEESLKMLGKLPRGKVTLLCGTGNNGGDGLVAARHLFNHGLPIQVIYLGNVKSTMVHPELNASAINLNIVRRMRIPIRESKKINVAGVIAKIKDSAVIIDAIFGIGLDRPVKGFLKSLIEHVNNLKIPILAVDLPSGLDADRGRPLGVAIRAVKTVTFGAPKIGFTAPSAPRYTGEVIVADIGIPHT